MVKRVPTSADIGPTCLARIRRTSTTRGEALRLVWRGLAGRRHAVRGVVPLRHAAARRRDGQPAHRSDRWVSQEPQIRPAKFGQFRPELAGIRQESACIPSICPAGTMTTTAASRAEAVSFPKPATRLWIWAKLGASGPVLFERANAHGRPKHRENLRTLKCGFLLKARDGGTEHGQALADGGRRLFDTGRVLDLARQSQTRAYCYNTHTHARRLVATVFRCVDARRGGSETDHRRGRGMQQRRSSQDRRIGGGHSDAGRWRRYARGQARCGSRGPPRKRCQLRGAGAGECRRERERAGPLSATSGHPKRLVHNATTRSEGFFHGRGWAAARQTLSVDRRCLPRCGRASE